MDFIVTMRLNPGDKDVSVAEIRMYDAAGVQVEGQFLLEAETAETKLSMPSGGRMEVTEHARGVMYDSEQKATVPKDLTPEDPLADPMRPKPTPQTTLKGPEKKEDVVKYGEKKDDKADLKGMADTSKNDNPDPMKRK